jgi:hypothetical protein
MERSDDEDRPSKLGRGRPARGGNLCQEAIRSACLGCIAEQAQVTRASGYRLSRQR